MKKKIIIVSLIIVIIGMSIGYAIYSTSLNVNGTSNIASNWSIEVTNIKEERKSGKAVSVTAPTYTSSTATFNTKLSRPGDNIEYEVEITNKGTIDGKIKNITVTNPNTLIKVETRGISKGEVIKAGEIKKYIVRVYIEENAKINEDITSKIEVNTEILQDDNQIFNEGIDGVEGDKVSIISTIEESSYTSITGTVKANGKGLKYYYSLDGKSWISNGTSNTYKFTSLKPNTRYTVYYKVEDENNNYVTESKWIETKAIEKPIITVSNETEYSKSKNVTIEYQKIEGAKYYYRVEENRELMTLSETWVEASNPQKLTIAKNAKVYAKIEVGTASKENNKEVTKIDNEAPTLTLNTSSTSNSITVVANSNSNSGISKYEYSIDGGNTWIDNGKYNTYIFKKLTQGKTYEVKVRVTNNAGSKTENTKLVTTTVIDTPTFSLSQTSTGKAVKITYPLGCGSTYTCSYIKDGGTIEKVTGTTAIVDFTSSGNVIAEVNDTTNYVTSGTYTVNIIKSPITITSTAGGSVKVEDITKGISATSSDGTTATLNVIDGDTIKITATSLENFSLYSLKKDNTDINSGDSSTMGTRAYTVSGIFQINKGAYRMATAQDENYRLAYNDESGIGSGEEMQLWSPGGAYYMTFKYLNNNTIYYAIQNYFYPDMYVQVKGTSISSGGQCTIYDWYEEDDFYWYLKSAGSGYYYIVNKTGYCMDATPLESLGNGVKIYVKNCNNSIAQKWKFILY